MVGTSISTFVQVACYPWLPIAGTKASTLAGRVEVGKQQTVWVLRPVEHEVSPYRFVRAVKAFREEVTRVGEPLKLRGRRETRGKCNKGRPQDGRRDRRRP